MRRRIVVLSDGTGNSAAKVWRTNVWRVFESLDLSRSEQVAFYDDGVGTANFNLFAMLGGAFGIGLKRNLLALYKFVCRNHREIDDQVYGFGFSRGAFTIRLLAGLIADQGLINTKVPKDDGTFQTMSEVELHRKARAAYRTYRANKFHTKWPKWLRPETLPRVLLKRLDTSGYDPEKNKKLVNVRFLGLWDTVAAYGMPVEEMACGISYWIWPWVLPDHSVHGEVGRVCHALSIDDERSSFHPVMFDEVRTKALEPNSEGKKFLRDEKISQVWFPGAHSNVGGGYPDDSLAHLSLTWITAEAQACDLEFKTVTAANPQTADHAATIEDKDGRMYDPRKGLGGYYRYGPRDIASITEGRLARDGAGPFLPRIHDSVLKRIKNRAHAYAPLGLPGEYELVTDGGEVLSPEANRYETPLHAKRRWEAQQIVWDSVWLRRLAYIVTVLITLMFLAYPFLFPESPTAEHKTSLRWTSDGIRVLGSFLPSVLEPWVQGYARNPGAFWVLSLLLGASMWWGNSLAQQIRTRMDLMWQGMLAEETIFPSMEPTIASRIRAWVTTETLRRQLKVAVAPAIFAILFLYLGVVGVNHLLFIAADDLGWFCGPPDPNSTRLENPGDFAFANAFRQQPNGSTIAPGTISVSMKNFPGRSEGDIFSFNLPKFHTNQICQNMHVRVKANERYLIEFDDTSSFYDDGIPAVDGFASTQAKPPWKAVLMLLRVPLRRSINHRWFHVIARFGTTGGDESFLAPDPSERHHHIDEVVTATNDGDLFLYVNDAVIAVPWFFGWFYDNNKGDAKVLIKRVKKPMG